jgi:ribosome-associated heat shock protein Hsp15
VHLNDLAVKPAREVKPGDKVQLRTGDIIRTVNVLAISDQRGPAPVAALLYEETAESVLLRQQAAERHRLAPEPALTLTQGRPTKRDRRDGEKLRGGGWGDRWSASINH